MNPFDEITNNQQNQAAYKAAPSVSSNPFDNSATNGQVAKPNKFIDAMQTVKPNYIAKGQGSGQGGKRTFGDIYHNIGEAEGDFAVGAAKALIRTPVHLAQFLTGIGFLGDQAKESNSILNRNSAQGQYFNEAAKGNTGLQKAGATTFDLGTAVLPIGEVGAATEAATKTIPRLAELAANPGIAGKIARYVPKAAAGIAETVAGNAAFTGGGSDAKDIAIGALTPAAIQGAAMAYRGIRALTPEGRAALSSEAANDLFTKAMNGDKFAIGKLEQDRTAFHNSVDEMLKSNPNVRANKAVNNANIKLSNLENRTAMRVPDYEPSNKDVIDQIWSNGKLDGVGKDGRPITTNAQERQMSIIENNAQKAQQLFESASMPVDSGSIVDDFVRSLDNQGISKGGIKTGTEIGSEKRALYDFISEQPELHPGAQTTPGNLFKISKRLRDMAYKADGIPTETAKAQVYRDLASKIDDKIFNNVDEIDTDLANELRKNQAVAYSTLSALKALGSTKVPGTISKSLAQGLGYLTGQSLGGGLFGGIVGSNLGEQGAAMLNRAYGNKNLASEAMQQFANIARKTDWERLQKLVDTNIASNVAKKSIRDYAEQEVKKGIIDIKNASKAQAEKNAAEKASKIKDFIESVIGKNKGLPAPVSNPMLRSPEGPSGLLPASGNTSYRTNQKLTDFYVSPKGTVTPRSFNGKTEIISDGVKPPRLNKRSLNSRIKAAENTIIPYVNPDQLPTIRY